MTSPRVPRLSPDGSRWLLCGAAAAVAALAAHFFGLTLCPLKRLAGIPCPTCGTTRACLALFRGEVCTALSIQPYALFALAALLACALLPRLRVLAAALWRRPSGKLFAVLFILASWFHNLLHNN